MDRPSPDPPGHHSHTGGCHIRPSPWPTHRRVHNDLRQVLKLPWLAAARHRRPGGPRSVAWPG